MVGDSLSDLQPINRCSRTDEFSEGASFTGDLAL